MSIGWPRVRLGDVLRFTPRPVTVEPSSTYREIGIRSHGRGIFHKSPVTGLEIGEKRVFYIEPGDFVLNIVFAWEGAVGVASSSETGMIASHRFPTFRPDPTRPESKYLLYWCQTEPGRNLLDRVSPGGAGRNRTLNRVALQNPYVPLLPLMEQQRIVKRIEELAISIGEVRHLRENATRQSASLWARRTSIILDRLTEVGPLRRIEEVVTTRGGGTPPKADPSYWVGSLPWVTPKDMKVREIWDSLDHISERAARETAAKVIGPGAVLVVVRGMILAHTLPSAALAVPAAINQDMKALVPNETLLPDFLCALLWAYNSRFLRLIEKSTHDTRKLETATLLRSTIPVPSLPEQHRVMAEINALRAQVELLQRLQSNATVELEALPSAILSHAFNEELSDSRDEGQTTTAKHEGLIGSS